MSTLDLGAVQQPGMRRGADGARRVAHSSVSIIPKSKRKAIRYRREQKSRPNHAVQLQKSSAFSVESQGKITSERCVVCYAAERLLLPTKYLGGIDVH